MTKKGRKFAVFAIAMLSVRARCIYFIFGWSNEKLLKSISEEFHREKVTNWRNKAWADGEIERETNESETEAERKLNERAIATLWQTKALRTWRPDSKERYKKFNTRECSLNACSFHSFAFFVPFALALSFPYTIFHRPPRIPCVFSCASIISRIFSFEPFFVFFTLM